MFLINGIITAMFGVFTMAVRLKENIEQFPSPRASF
jgi:hypothetical protein